MYIAMCVHVHVVLCGREMSERESVSACLVLSADNSLGIPFSRNLLAQ